MHTNHWLRQDNTHINEMKHLNSLLSVQAHHLHQVRGTAASIYEYLYWEVTWSFRLSVKIFIHIKLHFTHSLSFSIIIYFFFEICWLEVLGMDNPSTCQHNITTSINANDEITEMSLDANRQQCSFLFAKRFC